MSMKYLWTLTLVVVSVGLMVGAAAAQDAWQVALDDEDPPNRLVDLPAGMLWDDTYAATVDAENTGVDTWIAGTYQLLSVEGATDTALTPLDRWGLTEVALGVDTPTAAVNSFAFTVTAPPISGTFECDWTMGNSGAAFGPDLAEADVLITRHPDTQPGTAGEWAVGAIEACAGRVPFIVQGYADGLYRPALTINRDAMAVFMRRAAMIPELLPAEPTFPDVPADHWAFGSVEACADAGIVYGYGDGSYQPNLGVTRAQMAVYVARAVPLDFDPDVDPAADVFPDVPVGFWADNEIEACVDAGVVQGYPDGLYRPTAFVDRAQMAVYSMRAFIDPTFSVVVMGGPGATLLDPLPSYHGWSSSTLDPVHAYVEFDAARLGPELAAAGGGTWDVTFYFGPMDTPTTTPETTTVEGSAMVSFDAADLTGLTGDYFTAAADIPGMTPGMKLMWVEVETPTGGTYQLGRTVSYEQSAPPPPPGAPRVPNAIDPAAWNVPAGGWGSGREVYHSGTFSNMMTADDAYYTMMVPGIDDWGNCCTVGQGLTLKWTGLEIPVGATEMRLRLEYHVYDPEDGTGQNQMACADNGWCNGSPDTAADAGGDGWLPNMCSAWGGYNDDPLEGPIDLVWWIDGTHVNYGWGLAMVNFADAWDFDGSGTGSPSAEIQDTPAEGGLGGMFAYNPETDLAMEWVVTDWTNFVTPDAEGYTAAIHWCGGCIFQLVIDQCTIEFNPHP